MHAAPSWRWAISTACIAAMPRCIKAAHAARPSAARRADLRAASARALPPRRPAVPPHAVGRARRATRGAGVTLLYELPFDHEFSLMPAETFVTEVLHEGLGARHLVCGPDFAFGRRRGGDTDFLATRAEALGMGLTLVPLLADARRPDLRHAHPPRVAGRLSRTRHRRSRPPLDHPRRRRARRRARPHHRLPHRQHRPRPPPGARARRLCGDGPRCQTARGATASPTSAAARR